MHIPLYYNSTQYKFPTCTVYRSIICPWSKTSCMWFHFLPLNHETITGSSSLAVLWGPPLIITLKWSIHNLPHSESGPICGTQGKLPKLYCACTCLINREEGERREDRERERGRETQQDIYVCSGVEAIHIKDTVLHVNHSALFSQLGIIERCGWKIEHCHAK